MRISIYTSAVAVAACLAAIFSAGVPASAVSDGSARQPHVTYPLQFAVTEPVRDMPPQASQPGPPKPVPIHRPNVRSSSTKVADPVVQTSPTLSTGQTLGGWEGLGEGYPGYTVLAVPPDPNIAVGPNHIVQWVNNAFVVFDKQGNQLQAPVDDGTFWGALSTCNQLGGFSDPIIQYDRMANRWIVGEVAIPFLPPLYGQWAQCFAVSTTPDPRGSYYIWAYGFGTDINDYPKISVWPDGYYVTWNIFANETSFVGPEACAFDRTAMLNGASAPALVCFTLTNAYASLLPSDLDGAALPPPGSPNFFMSVDPGSAAMYLWKLHVDFAHTQNSTFVGPTTIAGVAPFTSPCLNTQDCIPQPGTTQKLDALGDRLMNRLVYRNFGDHESIVANHTVLTANGNTAVRWYEVRSPNGAPTVYQQGTFAPDSENRWMASVAMDKTGNIGVGYSVGSSLTYPSIGYSGWEAGSPLGALQAETLLAVGGGSQTAYNRWGDYSAMQIDPSDDCTFWYTQEYQAVTQTANWNTYIGSFRFPSCGQSLTPTTTLLSSTPNPSTEGENVTFTADVSPTAATGNVEFFDGAVSLGTSTLSSGTASLMTPGLSAGNHSITASYQSDGTYASSTSSALTQTVQSMSGATENLATADYSTSRGTIGTGTSYQDTWVNDSNSEVLTEEIQGGNPAKAVSMLDHTWTFDVAAGSQYTFGVNAFHNGTEDDFAFSYSRDNSSFTPMLVVSATSDTGVQQTFVFPEDVRGTLYVRVQDTDRTRGHSQQDSLFVDAMAVTTVAGGGGNTAPGVTITAPTDGSTVTAGTSISFTGTASDNEDGNLTAGLSWSSSLDGSIGSGGSFSTSSLSVGVHAITASVTDSGGLVGADTITVTVTNAGGITLSATGYKVKGVQNVDLAWSGATTTNVTINRNGFSKTVANTGAYTDNIGVKGSATYQYQVCEAPSGACSNIVTVAF